MVATVGTWVGASVGACVDADVGDGVGRLVLLGACVGDGVVAAVGTVDPARKWVLPSAPAWEMLWVLPSAPAAWEKVLVILVSVSVWEIVSALQWVIRLVL